MSVLWAITHGFGVPQGFWGTETSSPPPLSPPPAVEPPASSSSHPSSSLRLAPWDSLPVELLDLAFTFLPAAADRGAAALVCKSWNVADKRSKRSLTIHDGYAVAPQVAVDKFPNVRAAVLKSEPLFRPPNAQPWVVAAADGWPLLQELSFEWMIVTDGCLHTIAARLPNLKVLRINKCYGFSTTGLAAIAQGCSNLRELDLEKSQEIDNNPSTDWLSYCPESLETLNFKGLRGAVNFTQLEMLVSRCRNLKTLKPNMRISPENAASLLRQAPQMQIVQLGASHPDRFVNWRTKMAFFPTWRTRMAGARICPGMI